MTTVERRQATDRRVRPPSVHFPERRTGFRRRDRGAMERALDGYRSREWAVAAVIVAVLALNAADLALTLRALDLGATEANPVMAALFGLHPAVAAAFKLSIVAAVAGVLWWMRRYRLVLTTQLLLLAGFTALLAYHLIGSAAIR